MSKSSTNNKTQKQEDSRVFCIDMFKGKQSRNFNKSWTEFHNSISNAQECVHLFVEGLQMKMVAGEMEWQWPAVMTEGPVASQPEVFPMSSSDLFFAHIDMLPFSLLLFVEGQQTVGHLLFSYVGSWVSAQPLSSAWDTFFFLEDSLILVPNIFKGVLLSGQWISF